MTDELTLLTLIQAGDREAFATWASQGERSLRLSLRPFATLVDTEAVLQEALLRVWQVAPRFVPDGRPAALLRFAARTARHCALSELRRARPTPEALDTLERALEAQAEVAPITPDPHLRALIARCRGTLPRQPSAVLALRLADGGTQDDTTLAATLRMSLNTFLQNFSRARKLLRACLEKAGVALEQELS